MMNIIVRIWLSLIVIMMLSFSAFCKDYRVAIFDFDHRPADELTIAKYIEKQLKASGLSFREISQFSGEGDERKAFNVLSDLDNKHYDLIITITSDALILARHIVQKTPLLFTNVNNSKIFGIFDLDKPGQNMSGVTYYVPVAKQLELFREINGGKLQKIGLIFDDRAKSRRAEVREFRRVADRLNIKYEIQLIKSKEELPTVTKALLKSDVDAIILTSSDKLYKNVGMIVDMCTTKKVPIFSVNKKGVEQGAVAAFASDYYVMVDECLIPMAIEVLQEGKNPGNMAVRSLKKPMIYLNMIQAEKLGLIIPADIKKRVTKEF